MFFTLLIQKSASRVRGNLKILNEFVRLLSKSEYLCKPLKNMSLPSMVGFLNPNWHELRKQKKISSLAPQRSKFFKTQ